MSEFQAHLDASLFALLNKSMMDFWILVFVIDLRTARRLDFQSLDQVLRSEERRVGKECRL